jgi:hypothetical protein
MPRRTKRENFKPKKPRASINILNWKEDQKNIVKLFAYCGELLKSSTRDQVPAFTGLLTHCRDTLDNLGGLVTHDEQSVDIPCCFYTRFDMIWKAINEQIAILNEHEYHAKHVGDMVEIISIEIGRLSLDGAVRDGLVAEMDKKAEEKVVELDKMISLGTDVVEIGNLRHLRSTLVAMNSKMGPSGLCNCSEDPFLEEQMEARRAWQAVAV